MVCIASCLFVVFIKTKLSFILMDRFILFNYIGVRAKLNKYGHFCHVLIAIKDMFL